MSMDDYATTVSPTAAPAMCSAKGSGGIFFPIWPTAEDRIPDGVRAALYLAGLFWTFIGVSIVADMFMAAIETITSSEVIVSTKGGGKITAKTWNATVANLTLMALGSSAPEILLSVIEILANNYYIGELGPSTIVGSAAFNLLVISAVCVVSIAPDDKRIISEYNVFGITAFASIFAYVWLLIILVLWTPNVVTVPEAVITFLFFPFLVWAAYRADAKQWPFGQLSSGKHPVFVLEIGSSKFGAREVSGLISDPEIMAELKDMPESEALKYVQTMVLKKQRRSRAAYRVSSGVGALSGRQVVKGAKQADLEHADMVEKRARERAASLKSATGKEPCRVQFATWAYSCIEGCGAVPLTVSRSNAVGPMRVWYETEAGTATANEDYKTKKDWLSFADGELEKTIEIEIIDDDEIEDDEYFTVRLSKPQLVKTTNGNGKTTHPDGTPLQFELGGKSYVKVTIVDDDKPGVLGFQESETHLDVCESDEKIEVTVRRFDGCIGTLSCDISVVGMSAVAGRDFEPLGKGEDKLVFLHGELEKKVRINVVDDASYEKDETFKVVVSNVIFKGDKAEETAAASRLTGIGQYPECIVTIKSDDSRGGLFENFTAKLNLNSDKIKIGTATYSQQFHEATHIVPQLVVDDAGNESLVFTTDQVIMHIISLPWKVLFSIIPPTDWCGGKATFVVAICLIGLVTAFISDLASLFGCVAGLEDSVTAITFVALGTSLPDTFASRTAAIMDQTADASIGNITGSNAVNVFLGLGMPWTLASIYWAVNPDDKDWHEKYGNTEYSSSKAQFVVPAGALGFSVTTFVLCGCTCIGTLMLRRKVFGSELGGPMTTETACFFCLLWFTYVLLSALKVYGYFKGV
jgi:solute carrier family 8 (sodium/calcium exchanger)